MPSLNSKQRQATTALTKKLKALELALHRSTMHPRFQLYFVREGTRAYTLNGTPINLKVMQREMGIPTDAIAIKVGNFVLSAFGKVKAVYAFVKRTSSAMLPATLTTTEYYQELLAFAHAQRIAPGFQYADFLIDPGAMVSSAPGRDLVNEWARFPWHIRTYRLSDVRLSLEVYRQTPKGKTDGVVEDTPFLMVFKRKKSKPTLAPVTLYLVADADGADQFLDRPLYPVVEPDASAQGTHWSVTEKLFTFALRLPEDR